MCRKEVYRVYKINKWSYVQLVSNDLFMKLNLEKWLKMLKEIEVKRKGRKSHRNSVVIHTEMEFSDKTDSYCNDTRTH